MNVDKINSRGEEKRNQRKILKLEALIGLLTLRGNIRNQHSEPLYTKTNLQKAVLSDVYRITKHPKERTRSLLGSLLGLTEREVQIWFQNQRTAEKKGRVKVYGSIKVDNEDSKNRKDLKIAALYDIVVDNLPDDIREAVKKELDDI